MSSNIVTLDVIKKQLQKAEGPTMAELMQQALDFHYEPERDEDGRLLPAEHFLAEDLAEVMEEAGEAETSKLEAVKAYLRELLAPYAEEIEVLYNATAN